MQSVCSRRASWLQLVQRKCADAKTTRSFGCNQSRSFYVISVLRKCFFGCVFQIFKNRIIINNSGKFEDLVLMTAKRQTYKHRDRNFNGLSPVGGQFASPCQTSAKSVKGLRRYGDLTVFKMAAVRHLGFWKFKFFNSQDG